jgi:calcineurin-like phosphoesterase family protein
MNKKKVFEKDKLFFTSDLHFHHENIIKFCNRPFDTVDEMNRALVSNWNSVVPPDGHIFILGDFMLRGSIVMAKEMFSRLNGTKYFIWGNHDHQNKLTRDAISEFLEYSGDALYITINDEEIEGGTQSIYMSHYPMLSWNGNMRGSWQLFGHVHSGPNSKSVEVVGGLGDKLTPAQYDVGVDNNNFRPISYEEIKVIITKQYLSKL